MKKKILFGFVVLFVILVMVNPVSALNPHPEGGSGQPNQSCQAVFGENGPFFPPGFNTDGFNFATTRYAGSGFRPNGNNPHAVAQYDVACFQNADKL